MEPNGSPKAPAKAKAKAFGYPQAKTQCLNKPSTQNERSSFLFKQCLAYGGSLAVFWLEIHLQSLFCFAKAKQSHKLCYFAKPLRLCSYRRHSLLSLLATLAGLKLPLGSFSFLSLLKQAQLFRQPAYRLAGSIAPRYARGQSLAKLNAQLISFQIIKQKTAILKTALRRTALRRAIIKWKQKIILKHIIKSQQSIKHIHQSI